MKKVLKVIVKIILGVIAFIAILLLGIFIFNRIKLAGEKKLLNDQQIAKMVEVDGHKMAVYSSGEGEHTLVFMAGAGAPCPILDYRAFTDRFDEDYKVVIIEKFGYGFSDEYEGSRDVMTRVDQNRKALDAVGITGPYILCPHSYTGLETVYWAQNYPEEVEAIIGLDMAVPRAYDMYDEALISSVKSANSVNRTLRELGLVRLFVGGTLPDEFTDEEKKLATALVCRKYNSKTASNEADSIIEDLNVIDSKPIPDVATLLIISDGTVTEGWIDFEMDYASKLTDVTTLQLDCGHSVYDHEPDRCEEAMRGFIEGLD